LSTEDEDHVRRVAEVLGYPPDALHTQFRRAKLNEQRVLSWLAEQVAAGHADDLDLDQLAALVFGHEAEPPVIRQLHEVLGGPPDEPTRLAAGRLIYSPSTLDESLLAAARPAVNGALARGLTSERPRLRDACLWAVFKLSRGDRGDVLGGLLF
jgi:HEAT repeat protein